LVNLSQQKGVVIGLATQHHPVEGLEVLLAVFQGLDAAIEDDFQFREVLLELRGDVVAGARASRASG
jgi:hypothetical protein